LRKNNFAELAPKFRSDLAAPIEQIRRNPDFEDFEIEAQAKMG